jgi:hypothetical protein
MVIITINSGRVLSTTTVCRAINHFPSFKWIPCFSIHISLTLIYTSVRGGYNSQFEPVVVTIQQKQLHACKVLVVCKRTLSLNQT